jgi:hypothetical protein
VPPRSRGRWRVLRKCELAKRTKAITFSDWAVPLGIGPVHMLDYHIDVARNIVTTRAAGRVNAADVSTYLIRLMRDPAFKAGLNALIVAMDASAVPGPVGVGALTPLIRAWSKRRAGVKWAFVLPDRATRDFVESAVEQARLTSVTARCFLSESAALAWLDPIDQRVAAKATPSASTAPHNVTA